MSEFMFVLKSFIVTVAIVFALQTEVGGVKVESHFFNWLRTSEVTRYLHQAAKGGLKAGKELLQKTKGQISEVVSDPSQVNSSKAQR